jgi:hypothetical protein
MKLFIKCPRVNVSFEILLPGRSIKGINIFCLGESKKWLVEAIKNNAEKCLEFNGLGYKQ